MENYLKLIENTIKGKWDCGALCDRGGISYTYGQMAGQIARLHYIYREVGIAKGDKIAVCGKNGANWAVAFISANAYGAVAVPLLNDFHPESIAQLTDHSESRILFIDEDLWKKVGIVGTKAEVVFSLKDFSLLHAVDSAAVSKHIEDASAAFDRDYPGGISPDDVCYQSEDLDATAIINYTSGTTSAPKGVMLSYRAISSNVVFIKENIFGKEGDKALSMLPMAHMYGMAVEFLFPVCAGYELHFLGKAPTPRILLDALSEVRPFMIIAVPLIIEKIFYSSVFPAVNKPLMKGALKIPVVSSVIYRKIYDKLMSTFGGNVKYIIIGGAPLNEAVEEMMKKVGLPYCVGYGMTECAPLISYEHYSRFAFRSCGKPVDRMEVRIDSPDATEVVGEIQTRGDNVMSGYYKNKDATAAAFTADGWLHTGDMGIMDAEGNIFIKGRCKNMVLGPNGQNIYPEEIEDKLNSHRYVVESIVVSRQGRLVALIYPNTDAIVEDASEHGQKSPADARPDTETLVSAAMDALLAEVNKSLPSYSKLSKAEVMATEFEKTPKKSIKRFLYE